MEERDLVAVRAREETALRIATVGLDEVLNSLTPALAWDGQSISVASGHPASIRLGGRRVTLYPSFFVRGAFVVESMADTVAVFTPHPFPNCVIDDLNDERTGRTRSDSIASLLGRTRAEALSKLADPLTTGELAEALGVCQAAASQHASTLRRAGLVTTAAIRNRRVHTLSSRGVALLFGDLEDTIRHYADSMLPRVRTRPA